MRLSIFAAAATFICSASLNAQPDVGIAHSKMIAEIKQKHAEYVNLIENTPIQCKMTSTRTKSSKGGQPGKSAVSTNKLLKMPGGHCAVTLESDSVDVAFATNPKYAFEIRKKKAGDSSYFLEAIASKSQLKDYIGRKQFTDSTFVEALTNISIVGYKLADVFSVCKIKAVGMKTINGTECLSLELSRDDNPVGSKPFIPVKQGVVFLDPNRFYYAGSKVHQLASSAGAAYRAQGWRK